MQTHFDTKQTAEYLNIPWTTLTTWRCTKRVNLPYFKLGGNVRYKKSDLDAFIAANTHGAVTANGGE
jgi:excisionase family DNA binding protein